MNSEIPDRLPRAAVSVIVFLLIAGYAATLVKMVQSWWQEPEMSHGILVPLVAGYALWTRRQAFARVERRVEPWGMATVGAGMLLLLGGTAIQSLFVRSLGLLFSIAGVLVYLNGWKRIGVIAAPLSLLVFTVQPPVFLYDTLTSPLLSISSWAAEQSLSIFGYSVLRDANVLHFKNFSLAVAEACSGLGGLFSLTFFSASWAYFVANNWLTRVLVLLCAIPGSIIANILRITFTGMLGTVNPEWTRGLIHSATGWLTLLLGIAIVMITSAIAGKFQTGEARV